MSNNACSWYEHAQQAARAVTGSMMPKRRTAGCWSCHWYHTTKATNASVSQLDCSKVTGQNKMDALLHNLHVVLILRVRIRGPYTSARRYHMSGRASCSRRLHITNESRTTVYVQLNCPSVSALLHQHKGGGKCQSLLHLATPVASLKQLQQEAAAHVPPVLQQTLVCL